VRLFNKEKWKKTVKTILSLDSHPGHISLGFSVGVFISFTPFIGIHSLMAIVIAFVFRLNKLTCVTATWVNTPLTVIPMLGLSYKLGSVLLGNAPVELQVKSLEWQYLKPHAASLMLGSSIIGFVAAILSYIVVYYIIVRFRQKDEALGEMTKEMEATGEELEP
jgi:uncharacterized protein (TIGR03546 family)